MLISLELQWDSSCLSLSTALYSPHLNFKLSLELDDKTVRNPLGRAEKLPDLPFPLSPSCYVGQAWWCWSYGFGRLVCAGWVTGQLVQRGEKPLSLNYQTVTVRSQWERSLSPHSSTFSVPSSSSQPQFTVCRRRHNTDWTQRWPGEYQCSAMKDESCYYAHVASECLLSMPPQVWEQEYVL